MKKERKISQPPFIRDNWLFDDSQLYFDLPVLIDLMKHELTSKNGEPISKILLDNHEKQILLTVLQKSTEIDSFQGNDSITFRIIEGRLRFHSRKESTTLKKGQLLRIHENIRYRLISEEETVFILVIVNYETNLCKN